MNKQAVNICTWIYCDNAQEESLYPQVGGSSSSLKFQEVYWKCVAVYFASSFKNNPNVNHILFTNTELIPNIGKFDLKKFLLSINVKIIKIPLTFRTPDGYFGSWKNQFYIFDILNYIKSVCEDDEQFIILDSDCIWIRPANDLSLAIEKYGLLTMTTDSENEPAYKMNGLSGFDMKEIYEEFGLQNVNEVPHYYGGEIFAAKGSEIKKVTKEVSVVWDQSIKRFEEGRLKFNEEAHMLSYIYFKLGYGHKTANDFIKRVWTHLFGHNNVDSHEQDLTVWHLPTEKKLGIKRLFKQVKKQDSLFWNISSDDFIKYIQNLMGLPRRNIKKFILDFYDSVGSKVEKKFMRKTS